MTRTYSVSVKVVGTLGELTGLAWEDIDLTNGEVHVKRTMTLTKTFGPPKTRSGIRTVKLLKPALEALTRQFEITGNKAPAEIDFTIASEEGLKSKALDSASYPTLKKEK